MKQEVQKIVKKIDALTLRERVILFVTAVLGLVLLLNWLVLEPQFLKQRKLAEQIKQEQITIAALDATIQQRLKARNDDPDAADRARLADLKQQVKQAQSGLLDMQKGLVSPDRMASLLEDILKRNGGLHLVSLKTLPVAGLTDALAGSEKDGKASAGGRAAPNQPNNPSLADGAIYKHGVEITMQGNYLDMLAYMRELESMPWQLFWGKAAFAVDEYPTATLKLTLYTLSLDKKWLNL
jgi:MSHA biogenesis protein MshJ